MVTGALLIKGTETQRATPFNRENWTLRGLYLNKSLLKIPSGRQMLHSGTAPSCRRGSWLPGQYPYLSEVQISLTAKEGYNCLPCALVWGSVRMGSYHSNCPAYRRQQGRRPQRAATCTEAESLTGDPYPCHLSQDQLSLAGRTRARRSHRAARHWGMTQDNKHLLVQHLT